MTARVNIERVGDTCDLLGESPWWDAQGEAFYWVDTDNGIIHRRDSSGLKNWSVGRKVGSMALRTQGGAVLALENGFHLYDFDTGDLKPLGDPEADDPRTRFNDGKTDRQGAFVAGTMIHDHEGPPICSLYRLNPDHSIEVLETQWKASNGPCFSPDGRTFYFCDSLQRTMFAYDYTTDGPLRNKRVLVDLEAYGSLPDGATVDADGCIWIVMIITGEIGRFTPDGRLDRRIRVPPNLPTSVNFGGPNLDILYLTSLSLIYDVAPNTPESGGLYAITDLGVQGVPEARFIG